MQPNVKGKLPEKSVWHAGEKAPAIYEEFASLQCLRLQVKARTLETVCLPQYRGSALRGAFGLALKKALCLLPKNDCAQCDLRLKCVFMYLFNTHPEHCSVEASRYGTAPHPFNFQLRVGRDEFLEAGQPFFFRITLTGRAVQWLSSVIHAFQIMGRLGVGKGRGRYEVTQVQALDGRGGVVQTLFPQPCHKKGLTLLGVHDAMALSMSRSPSQHLQVRFLSPLRVQNNGILCRDLSFSIFFRTILRRLENLMYFHCSGPAFVDWGLWRERIDQVPVLWSKLRWHDWERYSKRQDRRMKLGGLIGEVCFAGDLSEFVPALVLGSWLGVGKNTTFGLGTYELPDL